MSEKKESSIQVIDRAVGLMDSIANADQPVNLKYLAADSGLHTSTAFRILAALQVHGLVDRDEGGAYRLGHRLLRYAHQVRSRVDLRDEARPVMEALCEQTGETVNLTVRAGDEVVYIERVTPRRMMRVEQVVGSRAPLHVTAVGKLMLGENVEEERRAYAQRTGLPRYTQNTITDTARLLSEIETSCVRGFAYDDEEAEMGVGCIGVLVRDASGAAVAGLSISAPRERRRDEWIAWLQEAGRKISERLGYRE